MVMVINATYNNISVISWRSDLLVEKIGVPGENHRPVASHRLKFGRYMLICNVDRHDIYCLGYI